MTVTAFSQRRMFSSMKRKCFSSFISQPGAPFRVKKIFFKAESARAYPAQGNLKYFVRDPPKGHGERRRFSRSLISSSASRIGGRASIWTEAVHSR
jgi:hypothetical protein